MVFEQFLDSEKIKKHALFVFVLGAFFVLIAYADSMYFFKNAMSVSMLFTITLLLVPSIFTILGKEEKVESREGINNFLKNHKDIFKIYLFLILGIFFTFLALGYFTDSAIFDYQLNFLENRGDLTSEVITEFKESEYTPGANQVLALISHNIGVIIIAFILSIFYGAGALFLIVLNASMFAAFISYVIKQTGNALQLILTFSIHLVPEIFGFLVAAISGGVISRAIMDEKFKSKEFRNVLKDALVLLLISVGLIILAAVLEVFVTAPLFKGMI